MPNNQASELLAIVFLFTIPLLVGLGRYRALYLLAIVSIVSEAFYVRIFGFVFYLYSYIAMWMFTLGNSRLKSAVKSNSFYFVEFLIVITVGLYFLLIDPWDDPFAFTRTWTQQLPGRTLSGFIRLLEQLLVIPLFYFFHRLHSFKLERLAEIFSIVAIILFTIGLVDVVTGGMIKYHFVRDVRVIYRFTGLHVEPRAFAKCNALMFFAIFFFRDFSRYKNITNLALVCCVLSILLSMSTSALVAFLLCVFFYTFFLRKINFRIVAINLMLVFGLLATTLAVPSLEEHFVNRIEAVAVKSARGIIPNTPLWISSFEVFDAAAIAFMYHHPMNLFFGTGPNTVNIPSSKYLSPVDVSQYSGRINSVPHMSLVLYLSRSGILGLFVFVLGARKTLSKARSIGPGAFRCMSVVFLFSAIIFNPLLYLFIGSITGESDKKN